MTNESTNEELRALIEHASVPVSAPTEWHAPTVPMVAFRAGPRWLAVPAASVREVVTLEAITPVPGANELVLGVALVRGRLVPTIDVFRLLDIARTGTVATTRPRLVVISRGDDEVAVIAEETRGVLELAQVPSRGDGGVIQGELRWEGHLVVVLDPEAIVASLDRGRPA